MSEIVKEFLNSQLNSVEHRYAGSWPVYGGYKLAEHEEEGKRHMYVVRSDFDDGKTSWYSPLREPGLLIEFAQLFGQTLISDEEAAPKVQDWVERNGALGANSPLLKMEIRRRARAAFDGPRFKAIRSTLGADRAYASVDSEFSAKDEIQWIGEFVLHSVIANNCWQALAAAKASDRPAAEKPQDRGTSSGTPALLTKSAQQMTDTMIDEYLKRETHMRRYRRGDGTSFRGPGFHSLLGAMYLLMSDFRDAPTEDITFCRWCDAVVTFEQGAPPPSDAPKGTRGKHKTHSNREFCKEKYGVKDYCKNKWHYDQRKKAKERA